jgi:two-component system chemotaxis sensor kinase CheA
MTDQVLQTFFIESRELLEDMETQLLAVLRADAPLELVHAIFRAAHTIKGSAGLFGLDDIVGFTHSVETVLDAVRDGRLPLGDALVSLLLRAADQIRAMLDRLESGKLGADAALETQAEAIVEQLRQHLPTLTSRAPRAAAPSAQNATWHLSLRFSRDALRHGVDPLEVLQYLGSLGSIPKIVTLFDEASLDAEMDVEACALGFELALATEATEAEIEGCVAVVGEDCQLWLVPPRAPITAYRRLMDLLPEGPARLAEAFVAVGSLSREELAQADATPSSSEPALVYFDEEPTPAEAVAAEAVAPVAPAAPRAAPGTPAAPVVPAASSASGSPPRAAAQTSSDGRTIRVDADRLDQLIDLVGELIIASASAELISRRAGIPELREANSSVSTLVESLRDRALQLRMVKIGATFSRFQRVVHDVARELGKDIVLEIAGEDTELDKTVVEKLGDPLTHLVRNAIDHGIEPAEKRLARGKPARGTVKLNAFHDSGNIVIEVSDDGGGLDRDRIMAKAVERGLVDPSHTLTDREIFALVFEPGFSTAEKVTNMSGRGVGMDVVKRNITAFRGTVELRSEIGVGTTVTVRLPLTLAIINGFLVSVAGTSFVIPLDAVEECVAYASEPGGSYASLRGEVLPLVHTRELFALDGPRSIRQNIVVIRHGAQRAGLVVDHLMGEFQTVIKPLGKVFAHIQCLSGSTILGNGEVALIVDVPAILDHMTRASTAAATATASALSG